MDSFLNIDDVLSLMFCCCCWCVLVERRAGRRLLQGKELFSSKSFSPFFPPSMTFSPPKNSLCVLVITLSLELNDIGSQRLFNEHSETYGRNYPRAEFIHAAHPNPSDPAQKNSCFVSFQSYSFLLNIVKGRHLTGQIDWNSAWMVHSFTSVGAP